MRTFRSGFACLFILMVLASLNYQSKGQSHLEASSNLKGGAFVFKSTDGGDIWNAIVDFDTGLNAHKAQNITIDPVAPSTLYVGTNNGLAKTTDG